MKRRRLFALMYRHACRPAKEKAKNLSLDNRCFAWDVKQTPDKHMYTAFQLRQAAPHLLFEI
jgi:hypothetical protein